MRIVGLTGGIGTGKSTVSNYFLERETEWSAVIDCDKISREIFKPGRSAYLKVIQAFGKEILDENKEIKRKDLGEIVFGNKTKLKCLMNITGPAIMKEIAKSVLYHFSIGTRVVVLDAPTLLETGYLQRICAEVVVVATDEEIQVERVMKRDKVSEEVVRQKMAKQMPTKEKLKLATIVIPNNSTKDDFHKEIEKLSQNLKTKYGSNLSLSNLWSLPGIIAVSSMAVAVGILLR